MNGKKRDDPSIANIQKSKKKNQNQNSKYVRYWAAATHSLPNNKKFFIELEYVYQWVLKHWKTSSSCSPRHILAQ